jgi:glyoxylate utilization-related uncharacterized protein
MEELMDDKPKTLGPKRYSGVRQVTPEILIGDHGGRGPIEFRRLLTRDDFNAPVDFVDFTSIPPGSTGGLHEHRGNDEIYFIVAGSPLVTFAGEERRLQPGDIAVIRSGERHTLINDTETTTSILVVQVRYP